MAHIKINLIRAEFFKFLSTVIKRATFAANIINNKYVSIGKNSYFEYTLPYSDMTSEWNLHIIDENNEYSERETSYYNGLMKITVLDNVSISIKPGKAKSLIGKRFTLSATDNNGDNLSSIILEVVDDD